VRIEEMHGKDEAGGQKRFIPGSFLNVATTFIATKRFWPPASSLPCIFQYALAPEKIPHGYHGIHGPHAARRIKKGQTRE